MSQENVEVVRRVYAEWGLGNMRAGVDLFAPDILFESFMPDANQRIVAHSPNEVGAFMRAFLAQWRDYRLFADELRQADEKVLVIGRQSATGRESGVAVEDTMCSVWTFRDQKVVHLLFERDPQRAREAAGLSG